MGFPWCALPMMLAFSGTAGNAVPLLLDGMLAFTQSG
jgi:hypothetical protein